MNPVKSTVLSVALLLSVTGAYAASKVTVAVGHMCCGKCRSAATEGLVKVADGISIEGDNVTLTPKGDDLLPSLEAMRKSGFPAKSLEVSGPVTLGISHLCCGGCRTGLTKALTTAKLEALDPDSIKMGTESVTLSPKAGMKLDLIPLIAGMEKGGFSPSKITLGTAAARRTGASVRRVAAR